MSFACGMIVMRGRMAESTIAGLAGAYGNIGYMGPGLALATLGAQAAAPVALIFCFDNLLLFSLVPFLMAVAGTEKKNLGATALEVLKKIVLHPFIVATALGVVSAAIGFRAAARDRPVNAVPAERGGAMRAVRARCHGGPAPDRKACRGKCRSSSRSSLFCIR